MDVPESTPWSDPVQPTGSRQFTGPTRSRTAQSAGTAQLGINDLIWHEVADAVWLTAVTQYLTQRKNTSTGQVAQDLTAPIGPPAEQAEQPEAGDRDFDNTSPAGSHHDTSEPTATEAAHFTQTDLGESPQYKVAFLPASASIIRALRPLKIRAQSRREEELVLDEEAAAERAVQDGLWLPVTTPDTARFLDLTLVVDTSPSMALWRSTVKAFTSLTERLGAFRTIQLRLLDTHRTAGSPARPVLRGGTAATPIRSPAELLDPSGRRIVLVLTDGAGRCWQQHLVAPLLALWGRVMPLAVVNLLPQHLWERNGLILHRARLTVPGPLRPNRSWDLELPDAWLEPDPASVVPAGAVPVPVLELGARWLGW
ncbi:MAG: SAV_2336 N-terminal domain-related protein [Pseudonocardiaceae bacterium]